MRILILAAGYGTRLYPLTLNVAKSLIQINQQPIINFIFKKIERLHKEFNIKSIKIISNNKFYKDFLDWQKEYDLELEVLNDGSNNPQDGLGAVKDMHFGIGQDKDDYLILGGDNLFEDSLVNFVSFAQKNKPYVSLGLYDLKDRNNASHYGIVSLNSDNLVENFKEKPNHPHSTLAATCIYYFSKQSLAFLDQFVAKSSNKDAAGKYIEDLVENYKVFGYILKGAWFDIGQIETLRSAEKVFLAQEAKLKVKK